MTPSDTIVYREIASLIIVMRMRLITYRGPRKDAVTPPVPHPTHNPVGQVDIKNGRRWMESAVPM
jgi:hypothetical protein